MDIIYSDVAPNPAKTLILLKELGLPYETKWIKLEELKAPKYKTVNPNGRLPCISRATDRAMILY